MMMREGVSPALRNATMMRRDATLPASSRSVITPSCGAARAVSGLRSSPRTQDALVVGDVVTRRRQGINASGQLDLEHDEVLETERPLRIAAR